MILRTDRLPSDPPRPEASASAPAAVTSPAQRSAKKSANGGKRR